MKINHCDPTIDAANEGALRTATFRHILHSVISPSDGDKLVDLGAGPCKFSEIARDSGFTVTAVDGRTERLPSSLQGIEIVQADVRDVDLTGFDVVVILGLLYHLTLEDQIDLLRKSSAARSVIVDTQVHIPDLVVERACRERGDWHTQLAEKSGYSGVEFPEAENPMASIGNSQSWWHTEDSIARLFQECGYEEVLLVGKPYVSKYGARRWYVLS